MFEVARRRGIDRSPVDVTTEHGARVLQSFVWADQTERLERLRRAIEILRADPPELITGDYVELFGSVLRRLARGRAARSSSRPPRRCTSTPDELEQLRRAMHASGRERPFTYIGTSQGPDNEGYALEAQHFPGGEVERLAVFDFHGEWLEWGPGTT